MIPIELAYAVWLWWSIVGIRSVILGSMAAEKQILIWKDEGFYDYSGSDTDISMAAMWMNINE